MPKEEGTNKTRREGESVTLSCTYSRNNVYLYWYRQYPNGEPQYLLFKGAHSSDEGDVSDSRYKLTISPTSTSLTINNVNLSDSALYYCALKSRSPVIQSPQTLYKNTHNSCLSYPPHLCVLNHKTTGCGHTC